MMLTLFRGLVKVFGLPPAVKGGYVRKRYRLRNPFSGRWPTMPTAAETWTPEHYRCSHMPTYGGGVVRPSATSASLFARDSVEEMPSSPAADPQGVPASLGSSVQV